MITKWQVEEMEEINILRQAFGLKLLMKKERTCMWCSEKFISIGVTAYCNKCKAKFMEQNDEES